MNNPFNCRRWNKKLSNKGENVWKTYHLEIVQSNLKLTDSVCLEETSCASGDAITLGLPY